jgi:hypothetical protein
MYCLVARSVHTIPNANPDWGSDKHEEINRKEIPRSDIHVERRLSRREYFLLVAHIRPANSVLQLTRPYTYISSFGRKYTNPDATGNTFRYIPPPTQRSDFQVVALRATVYVVLRMLRYHIAFNINGFPGRRSWCETLPTITDKLQETQSWILRSSNSSIK